MGKVNLVVLSDLHLHPWPAFAHGAGRHNDRLRRSFDVLTSSLSRARELEAAWLFGGDLIHTTGFSMNYVLNEAIQVLARWSGVVPMFGITGNHDGRNKGMQPMDRAESVLTAVARAVPGFTHLWNEIADLPVPGTPGLRIYGAPAQPRPDMVDFGPGGDVGLFHMTLDGARTSHGHTLRSPVDARALSELYAFVVCGDVHQPDRPLPNVLVPGSAEAHGFGDTGDRGWWVVTLVYDGLAWGLDSIQMEESGSPHFITVECPADVRQDGNYYRVVGPANPDELPENAIAAGALPVTHVPRSGISVGLGVAGVVDEWLRQDGTMGERSPRVVDRYRQVGVELLSARPLPALRNMRLVEIELSDFMSHRSTSLVLDRGPVLMLGASRDFNSNGAGKSTIWEAVFWCLFGKTTKGVMADEVIRRGADSCSVSLTFEGEVQATIRRTRGPRSTEVEAEWGGSPVEGVSAAAMADQFCNLLGLTPEIFRTLAYWSQEDVLLFSRMTDGERKNILGDLAGLAVFQEASTEAARRARELQGELMRVEVRIDELDESLRRVRAAIDTAREQADGWQATHEELVRGAESCLRDAEAALAAAREEEIQWQGEVPLDVARRLVVDRSRVLSRKAEKAGAVAEIRGRLQDAERNADFCRSQIKVRRHDLEMLEKRLAEGVCPTCGQPLVEKTKYHERIAEVRAQIGEVEAQLTVYETDIAALERELESAVREDSDLDEVIRSVDAVVGQLQEYDLAMANWRNKVERCSAECDRRRDELSALRSRDNPYEVTLQGLEAQATDMGSRRQELSTTAHEIRDRAAVYEYWHAAFGKRGIQSYLLDGLARDFNVMRGRVFPMLTRNAFDVEFVTTTQTATGEEREQTDFLVRRHGELVNYSTLSGGERRRVDLGVMLVLALVAAERFQVPGCVGILVLDEVMGFLDLDGAEALRDTLEDITHIVPGVYVVSQDIGVQGVFDKVVWVEQGPDGVSRLAV